MRAIGETGLDFFRTGEDGRGAQFRSFEAHIDIAKRHGLALQIHDRDAHDDVLRRCGASARPIARCSTASRATRSSRGIATDEGWYLSFAGNVTFKNAENLREALRVAPRDRILVETDAPYLTPVPLRGRPNAPYLGAAHHAVHGRGARRRPRRVVRTGRVEHAGGVRTVA